MVEAKRYVLSVNRSLVDKPTDRNMKSFSARGWTAETLTSGELIREVQMGHAFAPLYEDGHRKAANFLSAGFLAADFDGSIRLNAARDNAFINAHASFIYTTASHTEKEHRFRVVFFLEEPICDAQTWANANFALAHKLESDKAIGDAARCFFGCSAAQVWQINQLFSRDAFSDLALMGKELRSARADGFQVNSTRKVAKDVSVKLASGEKARLCDVPLLTSIHCPYHDDRKPSAFVVRSWKDGGVGIHCRACRLTYWQDLTDEYDFDAFDRHVGLRAQAATLPPISSEGFASFFPPEPTVETAQTRFLPGLIYRPGITLVKSPKGTGKTEALKTLIGDIAAGRYKQGTARADKVKSILLVGHRIALLREAAAKLGLRFYKDRDSLESPEPHKGIKTLAVCLDSLPQWNEPYVTGVQFGKPIFKQDPSFDLVLMDESEQLLSHLIGGTIAKRSDGIARCFDALKYEVSRAKAVIALDADLGMLTAHALSALRPLDWSERTHIILNRSVKPEQERTLFLYDSETTLRDELIMAIRNKKRCFVATNSKKAVQILEKIIRAKFGKSVACRVITSDNSRNPAEIEFVQNIKSEFLKVQVLICSPSLGTGVDITFPDPAGRPGGLCKVDHVFGFFYPKVNTHTDMDQQLARVRNPGAVSVWISPARFEFSSNFDVIRDDLARARVVPRAVQGRSDDGMVSYNPMDPLLMICAHVTASQRASKNRLADLFRRHREAQGWRVERVTKRVPANEDRKEAQRSLWNENAKALLDSPVLDDLDYLDLAIRKGSSDPLSTAELMTFERNKVERTLGVPLTYEIIKLNYDGRLLDRVALLAEVNRTWKGSFENLEFVLGELSAPLARLQKLKPHLQLGCVLVAAGVAGREGIHSDIQLDAMALKAIVQLCSRNKTVLEGLLGQGIRKDVVENPIRQLNAFLKLIGLKLVALKRPGVRGKSLRLYGFEPLPCSLMLSLARRFRKPDEVIQHLKDLPRAA
jgi:hypothetical protein